jgi:hypothetical protein
MILIGVLFRSGCLQVAVSTDQIQPWTKLAEWLTALIRLTIVLSIKLRVKPDFEN